MILSLDAILVKEKAVEYRFSFDQELDAYFTGKPFEIEFPDDVSTVPLAVLAVPFVANVLPLVWLKDVLLKVPELDESFYQSISEFKNGYINMFPDAEWKGTVQVQKIINCSQVEGEGNTALFFSGGLDATTTVMRHIDERPQMLVIWGADIAFSNMQGWQTMYKGLNEAAITYGLELNVVHSSFRDFYDESSLQAEFYPILHDGWWHGVQHGIGLIGHAAPYSWLHHLNRFYIASSNCPEDGVVRCASHPTIDNYIRFCGCQVIHDGFELSRQDKIAYIVKRRKDSGINILLHVCWMSKSGQNCCQCEKCYRTIIGLLIEGADPKQFGFLYDEKKIYRSIYSLMALKYQYDMNTVQQWKQIQKTMRDNWGSICSVEYAKKIKWIKGFNFDDIYRNRCRKIYRVLSSVRNLKSGLARKFPGLYAQYVKVTGKQKR